MARFVTRLVRRPNADPIAGVCAAEVRLPKPDVPARRREHLEEISCLSYNGETDNSQVMNVPVQIC